MFFVKVGVDFLESIRSKNRIVRAFCQLEEGAILHVKAYLAKLGINVWAVDFTQSPYSMYNAAMRMCAIDTFRFLIAGTYYDFLHPDTRFVKDSGLLLRLYDHFVHRYLFDKWKVEVRTPGGNEITAERNKISQARLRVCFQFCFHYPRLIFPAPRVASVVPERGGDSQANQAYVLLQGYL